LVGACSTYGGEERSIQGFSEPEGKSSLGRPRRRWMLRKWEGDMDGIYLAYSRDRWRSCGCGNEPSGSIKCREFLD